MSGLSDWAGVRIVILALSSSTPPPGAFAPVDFDRLDMDGRLDSEHEHVIFNVFDELFPVRDGHGLGAYVTSDSGGVRKHSVQLSGWGGW